MTSEEHFENTVVELGDEESAVNVFLPVNAAMDDTDASHVAHMRVNEAGFRDVLARFVATGRTWRRPRDLVGADADSVRLALDSLGAAQSSPSNQIEDPPRAALPEGAFRRLPPEATSAPYRSSENNATAFGTSHGAGRGYVGGLRPQRSWCAELSIYAKEIVPLQIDRAVGHDGSYRARRPALSGTGDV